ncbi:Transposase (or an inactivated derivative) [Psychrobacillus sp. OK028]|uniref:IS256 family transposase n=1 Tax=Psychrobacillus sp. OK028 TaxID=1884359 RepID=UPI00088D50CD|nr:IS256 family transposase [Psychrobacillus sp. OK028]SDO35106.1 Transposase (or an inactivated derivative) [Psychrobacillus sp. OK028]
MSHSNIFSSDISNQIQEMIQLFLKEKLEFLLKQEIESALENEPVGESNSKNGYYKRTLDTIYGKVEDLAIPRDRKGQYQTALFDPYQRRMVVVDDLIVQLYQHGVTPRKVGSIIHGLLGEAYSTGTVSNITNKIVEDIELWKKRPLRTRYLAVYLDATFLNIRRDTYENEAVYIAIGLTEDGYREVLGFFVGGNESAHGWKEVLFDIKSRGVEQVALGIFDGLSGLDTAFQSVYPDADVQRCVVHKVRYTAHRIRPKDRPDFLLDLKKVYTVDHFDEAVQELSQLQSKWGNLYKREIASWEKELPALMTFLKYPKDIRKYLYTTNLIERFNREIKARTKVSSNFSTVEAAEKIVYLVTTNYNQRFDSKTLSGFNLSSKGIAEIMREKFGD